MTPETFLSGSGALGSIRQLGFVVHDLDRALDYWTKTLCVGPFFCLRGVVPENWQYQGQPSPAPSVSLAFANSAGMQIEIIQPLDEHPSVWRDFLPRVAKVSNTSRRGSRAPSMTQPWRAC